MMMLPSWLILCSSRSGAFVHKAAIVPRRCLASSALSGLLFDCGAHSLSRFLVPCNRHTDGVLADTEPNAHRPSFNKAFAEKGFADVWDVELRVL